MGLPTRWQDVMARSQWLAQDGCLLNGHNNFNGILLFDTPLAGTFDFSVDCYLGATEEGQVGYGGVVFEANRAGTDSIAWGLGYRDVVSRPLKPTRPNDYNRLTLQVSPKKVRCLANGQLYFEDLDPAPTSPWLMLVSPPGCRSVYRNPQLAGKPEPLIEVHLTSGDYFEGWILNFYHIGAVPVTPHVQGRRRRKCFRIKISDQTATRMVVSLPESWKAQADKSCAQCPAVLSSHASRRNDPI